MTATQDLGLLSQSVVAAFEEVHRRSFAGDRAANPRLRVEVCDETEVAGLATVVLVTPWTLNGLVLHGDVPVPLPDSLDIAGHERYLFPCELPGLGHFHSVGLVPDVSRLTEPRQARTLAASFVPVFHDALRARVTRP